MTTICEDMPCTVTIKKIYSANGELPEATFKVWKGFMFLWWFIRIGLKASGSSGDTVILYKCNTIYQWEIFPPPPYQYRKFLDVYNGGDRTWFVNQ